MYRGRQSGKSHHGCQDHINRGRLYYFVQRLRSGIYLNVRFVGKQLLQLVVVSLVGYHHGCRLELPCLLCQLLNAVVGCEAIDLI